MKTGEVLFIGGPHAGQRGHLEIRDHMIVVERQKAPFCHSTPNPWTYDGKENVWVCRYTRRCHFYLEDPTVYAPATWSTLDVVTELLRGYRP